jgi:tetratricopeptide (TPR) repeat protein
LHSISLLTNMSKIIRRLLFYKGLLAGGAVLACCGCAAMDQAAFQAEPPWACDARADAAVRSEDWSLALTLHEALLDRDPNNCLAYYHRGFIRGRLGDRQAEVDDYHRAAGCGYAKDDQLFFNLGMAHAELGQTELALSAFARAVALNPANADNHFGWGLAAQSLDKPDQAIDAFRRALEADPRHHGARLHLARGLLDQGSLKESWPHIEVLLKTAPEDGEVIDLLRRYNDRRSTLYEK